MNYKKLSSDVIGGFRRGIDFVLPPRCPQTGRIVGEVGDLSVEAWKELTFISDPICACCGFPFAVVDLNEPEAISAFLCGECLESPKPYGMARAALAYDEASRDLILAFKHGDQTHLRTALAPLMHKAGAEILSKADLIVPVPLHWRRLVSRRYNQAALLAKGLSSLADVPFRPDVLKRVTHTPPQGHKSNVARHENVRGVFCVPSEKISDLEGRKVVLVDDVYTTGATIEECARVLCTAGASGVDVLTVARVIKSH